MAYSNINKDKQQVGRGEKLKTAVFVAGLLILIASSSINIFRQFTTLKEARERNKKLENSIDKLILENNQMQRQINDATSSAFVDRKAREYFGLGTENDYWLIMPKDTDDIKIVQKESIVENKLNILKWWELFTSLR